MTNTTLQVPATSEDTVAIAELLDTHRRAGFIVATLSEDANRWSLAEPLAARLVAEADHLTGRAVTARQATVPSVVRCRDLAVAQRRLTAALAEEEARPAVLAVEQSLVRTRALVAELAELAELAGA